MTTVTVGRAQLEQGQGPVAYITPLMEQQMFDDWCPYKGNPDPRVVWAGAVEAVNGLLLGATPPQRKPMTMQPIIKDPRGVLRFKKNGLVDALHEHGVKTGLGLNELHCMEFTDEDRQQFAQLIGYSVGGYSDLSYVTDEAYEAAEQAAHGIKGE